MDKTNNNFSDVQEAGEQEGVVDRDSAVPQPAPMADLPPWLQTPVNLPGPPLRHRHPVATWAGTLAATGLMVAFGLWLGGASAPSAEPAPALAAMPAQAAPILPAVQTAPAPPLVLLPPEGDSAADRVAAVPAPMVRAPQPRNKVQGRVVLAKKSSAAPRKRSTVLAARSGSGPRASTLATPRFTASMGGEAPRMRCKRGELARECLARYRL